MAATLIYMLKNGQSKEQVHFAVPYNLAIFLVADCAMDCETAATQAMCQWTLIFSQERDRLGSMDYSRMSEAEMRRVE